MLKSKKMLNTRCGNVFVMPIDKLLEMNFIIFCQVKDLIFGVRYFFEIGFFFKLKTFFLGGGEGE